MELVTEAGCGDCVAAETAKDLGLLLLARRELRRVARMPRRAPGTQAYMKSEMPYHGVSAPVLRASCKELFADLDLPSREYVAHEGARAMARAEIPRGALRGDRAHGHKLARPVSNSLGHATL